MREKSKLKLCGRRLLATMLSVEVLGAAIPSNALAMESESAVLNTEQGMSEKEAVPDTDDPGKEPETPEEISEETSDGDGDRPYEDKEELSDTADTEADGRNEAGTESSGEAANAGDIPATAEKTELINGAREQELSKYQVVTLIAGDGEFDEDELDYLYLSEEELSELKLFVPEEGKLSDALRYAKGIKTDEDDREHDLFIEIKEIPEPEMEGGEFIGWSLKDAGDDSSSPYSKEPQSESISNGLTEYLVDEDTYLRDILLRDDIDLTDEKGLSLYALFGRSDAEKVSLLPKEDEGSSTDAIDESDEDAGNGQAEKSIADDPGEILNEDGELPEISLEGEEEISELALTEEGEAEAALLEEILSEAEEDIELSATGADAGEPVDISGDGFLMTAADKVFSGKRGNFTTTVVITNPDGKKLTAGKDYDKNFTYTYVNNTYLPDGTDRYEGDIVQDGDIAPVGAVINVKVYGIGRYTGDISRNFRISSADISKASVRVNTQYEHSLPCKPSGSQVEVKLGGDVLTEGEDYYIDSYENNVVKGKASLTVYGVGDYSGSKTVSFTIAAPSTNFTVIFNGNGSTSGSMKNISVAEGKTINLPANRFVRNGYEFTGWNTAALGNGLKYSDTQSVTNSGSGVRTIMLFAQWSAIEYRITPHFGGWSKEGFVVKEGDKPYSYKAGDATFTLLVPNEKDWPAGYQFAGWYRDSSFKVRIAEVKRGSYGDLDLYAKWVPYTYTVRFDGNGADEGSMDTETFSFGVAKALLPNKYKKSGLQFAGWAESSSDASEGIVKYSDKEMVCDLVTVVSGDGFYNTKNPITLYAVWKREFAINYKNLIFSEEDAAVLDGSAPTKYTYGTGVTVLPNAIRTGYSFGGWFTDLSFKKQVKSINKKSVGDITLYAKWNPDRYTIIYNGGEGAKGKMSGQSVYYGLSCELTASSFTNTGKVFAGWSLSGDNEENVICDKALVSISEDEGGLLKRLSDAGADYSSGRINLYAIWRSWRDGDSVSADKEGLSYTVRFDANIPADAPYRLSGSMREQKLIYGKTQALTKNSFKLKGYRFLGWSLAGSDEIIPDKCMVSDFGFYRESVTLMGRWEIEEYSVSYMNLSGADNDMNTYFYTVKDEVSLKEISKVGAVFLGWCSDAGLKKSVSGIKKGSTGNKVFYAKWRQTKYTINYVLNADDAVLDTTKAGYVTCYRGRFENGYVLATATRPTGSWYRFDGWCSDKACKKYVGMFIKDPQSDITLYAKWVPGTYSISFYKNSDAATGYMSNMTGLESALASGGKKKYNLYACTFTNPAYDFVGWSTEPDYDPDTDAGVKPFFKDRAAVSKEDFDLEKSGGVVKLYAVWKIKTFTISYMETNGTRIEKMAPTEYTCESPDITPYLIDASADNTSKVPVKSGYTFMGWYLDKDLKVSAGKPEVPHGSYGNLTLYAKWYTYVPGIPDDTDECYNVTDEEYGAVPDDGEDDTSAINRALRAAHEKAGFNNSKTVYIPAGVYEITATDRHSIKVQSNVNLLMDPDAVLKVTSVDQHGDVGIIGVNDESNIVISGGKIIGARSFYAENENGHGVQLLGAKNITIANMVITENWGDGVYIGVTNGIKCEDITIRNCEIYYNRRNNITITYGDNTRIEGCNIHDADGTEPQAGICVEPNTVDGEYPVCDGLYVKDTTITSPYPSNWRYRSYHTYNPEKGKVIVRNVTFDNCYLEGWFGNFNGEEPTCKNGTRIVGTRSSMSDHD